MTTGNGTDVVRVSNSSGSSSVVDAILSTPQGPWDSLAHVTTAALIVFILSPLVICSNALLVVAIHKFKKLRNPSNYFLLSLASADLGVGLCLPLGLYFEMSKDQLDCSLPCVFPYCVLILLCSVSLLSITAVAVDRYTSLALPLRYNNIITQTSVGRYISAFWIYSLLASSIPVITWYWRDKAAVKCSFEEVPYGARVFLFFFLFAPCSLVIVCCYGYVYVIARSHARAIFSVEVSFRQNQGGEARYGRTLAVTVGLFLLLWCPFNVWMLIGYVEERTTFYLGLLLLSNSGANPWVYGFRNTEFRAAFLKILDDLLPKLSRTLQKHSPTGCATSCGSNVRLCVSPQKQQNGATPAGVVQTSIHLQVPETIVEITTVTSPFLSPSSAPRVAKV